MDGLNGANDEFLSELEALLGNEGQQETPPANGNDSADTTGNGTDDSSKAGTTQEGSTGTDTTKAFAKRLKESTDKARLEEREAIAKTLGYESYDALLKEKHDKEIRDKGYNPDEVSPLIEKLVKERLDNDPRMKELAEYRKKETANFAKQELEEIKKLTDGKITKFDQLSAEVINLWKQKGSLKAAYLEAEGENLVNSIRASQSKGTTEHMGNIGGGSSDDNGMRHLTDKEKATWRLFNPNMSEEELNKKLVKKEG